MSMWKNSWFRGKPSLSTSEVVGQELVERDSGLTENAMYTAEKTADSLGRLAEALENKGIFTPSEIQEIFQFYGFDEVDE